MKSQAEGLHPTFKPFTEIEHMKRVRFLSTVTSLFRALDKSETVDVPVFTYLLSEDAKDAYEVQVNSGTVTSPLQAMWPYAVHALLARFLTEHVLHVSYHTISCGEHGASEESVHFGQKMLCHSQMQ